MPADSGTQQQQRQQHEFAYDACRLLSRQTDVSDACVLCLYYYSTTTVLGLLPSLLPPMTCAKPNPDAIFGWGFHPKMDPSLLLEADPKTISENGSLKHHQFWADKIAKQNL